MWTETRKLDLRLDLPTAFIVISPSQSIRYANKKSPNGQEPFGIRIRKLLAFVESRKSRPPSSRRQALHDLERVVATYLFVICSNNSGSTFLQKALATSRRTWNLPSEGRKALGYARPRSINDPRIAGSIGIWDDLGLRQRLPVKGRYHEVPTDMNTRQIAGLGSEELAAFNRVFRRHEDILAHFGYGVMEGGR